MSQGKDLPKNYRFTAQTCFEMFPTLSPAQLDREFQYLKSRSLIDISDYTLDVTADKSKIVSQITTLLIESRDSQVSERMNSFNTVLSRISEGLENAQELLEQVSQRPSATPSTLPELPELPDIVTAQLPRKHYTILPKVKFDENVFHFAEHVDFKDFTVDEVLESLSPSIRVSGGRLLEYRGQIGYDYARMSHKAKPYGSSRIENEVFKRLGEIDPDVKRDTYTMLANYYPNGSSSIAEHHDDEPGIVQGSVIYTISIGAARTLRLVNKSGPLQEKSMLLPHGSVSAMNASSQKIWAHSIDPEGWITEPRISLTLRMMDMSRKIEPSPEGPVPPIRPPKIIEPSIATGTSKRVLFLTDSVLRTTPCHILNRAPKHRVVKKTNYELVNVLGFEPEFEYSDIVMIACGINDLSRYGKSAYVLADLFLQKFHQCLIKHKHTDFVFITIGETKWDWLNKEVQIFNNLMFSLSLKHRNLCIVDTRQVLADGLNRGRWSKGLGLEGREEFGGNGVHLHLHAKKLITTELSCVVKFLASRRLGVPTPRDLTGRGWKWRLRPRFAKQYVDLIQRPGRGASNSSVVK